MKKLSLLLLALTVFALISPGCRAQSPVSSDLGPATMLKIYHAGQDPNAIKAVRDLWKKYGDSKNETWDRISDGWRAKFSEKSIQISVYYDRQGNWVATMRQYPKEELPKEIRTMVEHSYYDYSILWAKEITRTDGIAYQVHIENSVNWKNVWISEGEMWVKENFSKE